MRLRSPHLPTHRKRAATVAMPSKAPPADRGTDTGSMLSQGLRFLLLRFLPRRVLPILTAIEIFRLVQRLRRRGPEAVAPRRIVTVDPPDRSV